MYLTGTNSQRLHQQLIVLVQDTPVGETLSSVSEEDCEEMYQRYLHDFVRIVHKCTHKGQQTVTSEYKVRKRICNPSQVTGLVVHTPHSLSLPLSLSPSLPPSLSPICSVNH